MSGVRPLERSDLEDVCRFFERAQRSGSSEPPPGLVGYFERTLFDQPWADPEIPSLVYEDRRGRIVGMIGSHVRRLRLDGHPVRMAYSGQFLTDPDARGAGALILRAYLEGPQHLTITDAADEVSRRMWEKLGGYTLAHCSISWTRVFHPAAAARASSHSPHRLVPALRLLAPPLDFAARLFAGHFLEPSDPDRDGPVRAEPLTAEALLELMPQVATRVDLYPDYDLAFLEWLFREVAAVEARGTLVRKLLRAPDGRVIGWYVYYLAPFAQVLQLAAPGGDPGPVLDHLFRHAADGGAAAVGGRVEPALLSSLAGRRCVFRPSSWTLVHSGNPRVLAVLGCGNALLTRLDGEWWMGHDLLWRDPDARSPHRPNMALQSSSARRPNT